MTFLWPDMLWLLLTVPALVAGYTLLVRRKKKVALRYASLSVLKDAMGAGQWHQLLDVPRVAERADGEHHHVAQA